MGPTRVRGRRGVGGSLADGRKVGELGWHSRCRPASRARPEKTPRLTPCPAGHVPGLSGPGRTSGRDMVAEVVDLFSLAAQVSTGVRLRSGRSLSRQSVPQ
jgi:hypothetical protein